MFNCSSVSPEQQELFFAITECTSRESQFPAISVMTVKHFLPHGCVLSPGSNRDMMDTCHEF